MFNPKSQVRLFVTDEILTTTVLLLDGIQKHVPHEHNIIKVDLDGHGTMTRDEFVTYCVGY